MLPFVLDPTHGQHSPLVRPLDLFTKSRDTLEVETKLPLVPGPRKS